MSHLSNVTLLDITMYLFSVNKIIADEPLTLGSRIDKTPPPPRKKSKNTHKKENTITKLSSEHLKIISIVKWSNLVKYNLPMLKP